MSWQLILMNTGFIGGLVFIAVGVGRGCIVRRMVIRIPVRLVIKGRFQCCLASRSGTAPVNSMLVGMIAKNE